MTSSPGRVTLCRDVASYHRAQLVDEKYWHRRINEKRLLTWEGDVQGGRVTR
jgi:hypothetical protein